MATVSSMVRRASMTVRVRTVWKSTAPRTPSVVLFFGVFAGGESVVHWVWNALLLKAGNKVPEGS